MGESWINVKCDGISQSTSVIYYEFICLFRVTNTHQLIYAKNIHWIHGAMERKCCKWQNGIFKKNSHVTSY
jgi:hypothetical protein